MARVITFTCKGEKDVITMQHIEVENPIDEAKVKAGTLVIKEIGPTFDLRVRREKMASSDAFKEACRQPKVRNVDKKR